MGRTALGRGGCLVDRRADQRMTHPDEVAVDPQEAGALHLGERVLANTQGPTGATELSVAQGVVRRRQQHECLSPRGQPTAPVEEGPFHPG